MTPSTSECETKAKQQKFFVDKNFKTPLYNRINYDFDNSRSVLSKINSNQDNSSMSSFLSNCSKTKNDEFDEFFSWKNTPISLKLPVQNNYKSSMSNQIPSMVNFMENCQLSLKSLEPHDLLKKFRKLETPKEKQPPKSQMNKKYALRKSNISLLSADLLDTQKLSSNRKRDNDSHLKTTFSVPEKNLNNRRFKYPLRTNSMIKNDEKLCSNFQFNQSPIHPKSFEGTKSDSESSNQLFEKFKNISNYKLNYSHRKPNPESSNKYSFNIDKNNVQMFSSSFQTKTPELQIKNSETPVECEYLNKTVKDVIEDFIQKYKPPNKEIKKVNSINSKLINSIYYPPKRTTMNSKHLEFNSLRNYQKQLEKENISFQELYLDKDIKFVPDYMNDSFFSNLKVQTAKETDNSNSSCVSEFLSEATGEVANKKDDVTTQAGFLNESYSVKNPYSNESIKKNSFWNSMNCFSTGIKFKKKSNKH
jgi:hypothetical protein